ncbi:hypothetical protein CROQUDRAFT_522899 [Cronartium quercuum f. sp. fusiforme G11]|uniref:Uncharacterized protein n=1 Tax=Cronartium quercuum f. sp. fusiforme G11 TaxID=708437 RepID=A0A9P6N7K2_9BASI|nr:hypothetical protein CROQUDRAFT_522899 [Cronartium quercuum f. sp. fusiforme G11]
MTIKKSISRLLNHTLTPSITLSNCLFHTQIQHLNQHINVEEIPKISKSIGILQIKPNGKKFNDLIRVMNQKSAYLSKLEKIEPLKIESNQNHHNLIINKKSVLDLNRYKDDPEFKFDRKRGKRHIMNKLKNESIQGINPSDSLENDSHRLLVDALDISKRKPNINRISFLVPKSRSSDSPK